MKSRDLTYQKGNFKKWKAIHKSRDVRQGYCGASCAADAAQLAPQ